MNIKLIGITLVGILVLALAAGCATKGRISVIDFDLRTPEQISAYQFEAGVPYSVTTNAPAIQAGATALPAIWVEILEVLKVIKARFRVLSFEWDDRGGK